MGLCHNGSFIFILFAFLVHQCCWGSCSIPDALACRGGRNLRGSLLSLLHLLCEGGVEPPGLGSPCITDGRAGSLGFCQCWLSEWTGLPASTLSVKWILEQLRFPYCIAYDGLGFCLSIFKAILFPNDKVQ